MSNQSQPQNSQKSKKKKGGIIAFIIILVLFLLALILGLIIFIISRGIFKNPKKVFAENVVGVSKNINKEIPNIGSVPLDALFHLGTDDTDNSHTSTRTTYFSYDAMPAYDLELEQVYSYNADNQDASYSVTPIVTGTSLGTGSMYFSGNQFIFVPMDPASPMISYQIDSSAKESLKNVDVIDRFSMMIAESDKRKETDWNKELKNFSETALAGLSRNNFKKSKAHYTILGEEKNCNTVALTVSGDEAVNLINGFSNLIYNGIIAGDEEKISTFNSFTDTYTQNGGNLEITMTTYRYKKTPVAVVADITLNQDSYQYEINYYAKGTEKQMIINSDSNGDISYYEESVISTGIGKYNMTNKCDFDGFSITILQEGHQVGTSKEITGTFEITSKSSSDSDTFTSIVGNSFTGTIEETAIMGNGTKTTTFQNDKGTITITSSMSREPLDSGRITPPIFIPESGIDCGTNLEDLKTALEMGDTSKTNMDNSVYSLAQVYILMIKKSGVLNLL